MAKRCEDGAAARTAERAVAAHRRVARRRRTASSSASSSPRSRTSGRTGSRTRSSCACTARRRSAPAIALYRHRRAAGAAGRPAAAAVYVIPDPSPNAFATGPQPRARRGRGDRGILQMLSDDELEGVLAHELAHVKHRDILISSVAATLAAAIMMISRFAMFFGGVRRPRRSGATGHNPFALLATIILAPIAAMLIQAAISRSREFDADAGGAAIAGSPTAWSTRCARSTRRRSGSRSTPTRRPRTCSSSSRSRGGAAVALQHASADRRAHPGAARAARGRTPSTTNVCSQPRRAGLSHGCVLLVPTVPRSLLLQSDSACRRGPRCWIAYLLMRRSDSVEAAVEDLDISPNKWLKPRSASSIARSKKPGAASTRC